MRDIDRRKGVQVTAVEASKASVVVPLIEESLQVGKRTVDKGGYRIVKTVSVREEWVDEPLITHTSHVERRPIGRLLPTFDIPPSRQEGNTLIVSIVEEVLVTEKRLRLKEELHIEQVQAVIRKPMKYSLQSEEIVVTQLEPGNSPDPSIS